MKKIFSFIIVLVLSLSLFAFVGCGKDGDAKGGKVVIDGLTIENGVVVSYEPASASDVELVIPEKAGGGYVSEIAKEVFRDCKALKTITIPASIRKIGKNAFRNCTNLEAVYITDVAGWAGIAFDEIYSNPITNCNNLYLNGELLEEVSFPSYVTRIERYAFYMCLSIKKISISRSITFIGKNAFSGMTSTLEKFEFEQPFNWIYDTGSGTGSMLPAPALQISYPKPGTGYTCAINCYNHEGHYDWVRTE